MNMIEFPLSVTHRCPKAVVEAANVYAPEMKAKEDAPKGACFDCMEHEMIQLVDANDFILTRTKTQSVKLAIQLMKENKPCQILGKDIGGKCDHILWKAIKELGNKDVNQLVNFLETNKTKLYEGDEDLIDAEDDIEVLIELLKCCQTIDDIYVKIRTLFSDEITDKIILSTIHKSKGLETDNVYVIMDKLPHPKVIKQGNIDMIEQDTINLPYVAFTRAKKTLYKVYKAIKTEERL